MRFNWFLSTNNNENYLRISVKYFGVSAALGLIFLYVLFYWICIEFCPNKLYKKLYSLFGHFGCIIYVGVQMWPTLLHHVFTRCNKICFWEKCLGTQKNSTNVSAHTMFVILKSWATTFMHINIGLLKIMRFEQELII